MSTCSDDCTDFHEYYSYGKDILNSQIKTEVKSFCQMTFIMFKLMFILYTIINAGFLNFIVNLHSTKLIFANRGLYYVACCKSP